MFYWIEWRQILHIDQLCGNLSFHKAILIFFGPVGQNKQFWPVRADMKSHTSH